MDSPVYDTARLRAELKALPSTPEDKALEAEIEVLAAKFEAGTLGIPRWKPTGPDPFGGNWEFLSRHREHS